MNRLAVGSHLRPLRLRPSASLCWRELSVSRFASTKSAAGAGDARKKYSATLLLPKTGLPLRLKNAPAVESKYRDRTTHELYRSQFEFNEGNIFILHDGPPYANGNLHMGHALNKILKDIINRYNVVRGRKVHYIPGWDCHGLPIEHKALAALGKKHTALDPVSVRREARKFALEAIDVQKAEMKLLGVMADWDVPDGVYRTLDHGFEIRQLRLFQSMVSKGFITHRLRPTYYSPSSRTALAEAELEYADHKSHSVYVAFPVEEADMAPRLRDAYLKGRASNPAARLHLAIWTTTPWSLPGNMGVTVGEEIEYAVVADSHGRLLVVAEPLREQLSERLGSLQVVDTLSGAELAGTKYTHLFHPPSATGSRPTVFIGEHVTADAGTGLVHSAPAHGHEDYDAFLSKGMLSTELRCPVDDDGCFTSELVAWSGNEGTEALVGKAVLKEGSIEMIKLLHASGALLAKQVISHRYPCDWRTKEPIIIRATPQWFADVDSLKPFATDAMERINFVPPTGKNRLSATVLSRSEWCISRQRSWGVPIPALIDAEGSPLLTAESLDHIVGVLEEKGVDHWWSGSVEDFVPPQYKGQTFTRGFDTLDVWFDSGTSWSLIEAAKLRPPTQPLADVYLEGSDQHRGWFQSSILTRLAAQDGKHRQAPYASLITHGFTTDETGAKMSKSLGNGFSPMDVINGTKSSPAYGSDTLRLWVAGVDYTHDASIGPTSISHAAELLRKLRSALRFMLGNISASKPQSLENVELTIVERHILHELHSLEAQSAEAYDQFVFNKVLQNVSTFTSSTLSSFYFDVTKDTLYCDPVDGARRQAIVATLHHTLHTLLQIVAPFVPHLAEEVYEATGGAKSSVFLETWTPTSRWIDASVREEASTLLAVRSQVLGLLEEARQAKQIRNPAEAEALIVADEKLATFLAANAELLPSILSVSKVSFAPAPSTPAWSFTSTCPTDIGAAQITLVPASAHQCPRCWLHTSDAADTLCPRCASTVPAT